MKFPEIHFSRHKSDPNTQGSPKILRDLQRYKRISKTSKDTQRHLEISNNLKDIQSIPKDTQRYPIISKTSKATPEKPKEPKILCEIYNYLSWPQRKGAFPDAARQTVKKESLLRKAILIEGEERYRYPRSRQPSSRSSGTCHQATTQKTFQEDYRFVEDCLSSFD